MTTARLQDHHLADVPSDRIADCTLQAEAFLAYFSRLPAATEIWDTFRRWANTKDFSQEEAQAIAVEVHALQQGVPRGGGER